MILIIYLDKIVATGADDGQIMISSAASGEKIEQLSAYSTKVNSFP